MPNTSYLNNAHGDYIDNLYQSYKQNADNVDVTWQKFFEGYDLALQNGVSGGESISTESLDKEIKVLNLITGYRERGHLFTKTNPVRERRSYFPGKELSSFGLSEADLNTVFQAGNELGIGPATLKKIIEVVEKTYCESIGAEYKYMRNPLKTKWMETRMEGTHNQTAFTIDEKKRILDKLNQAVGFEQFLGTKFLGQKRFSLEGAESLIPAMDAIFTRGADLGIEEFVIGMAHRGRLNVLANIMQKEYKQIFHEFEGKNSEEGYGGDVKYHLGASADMVTPSGKTVHLSLCPNPSHLETVNPVVEGIVRAKMDKKYNGDYKKIAPILLHGDASVAGQGIIYEVLQMSKLDGYSTGGTIHIVINNQVGFTTNFKDARSSTYCTDIAKTTLSPVFHVNGDDSEALVHAIRLAMEYRQEFHNDVFIDLLCYRKFGHNESDEPRFTQPTLYKAIEKHPNPLVIYTEKLIAEGSITKEYAKEQETKFRALLQSELDIAKSTDKLPQKPIFDGAWKGMRFSDDKDFVQSPKTAITKAELLRLGAKFTELPKDKKFFKKIEKLFDERKAMFEKTLTFDWAMGEFLAYASLLETNHGVRISGQDVERGTFSHRHAVVKLEDSDEEYIPLANLSDKQAAFTIYNSHLSEYGVLGFEYGYAMASPNDLVIWEAQFGDFMNGAQIIIDQYITSTETKWRRSNGLVMLLPHGYEGQGPEHSSARMERFLESCADNNIQVVNCTTPANLFHALRRQLLREFRKPLVVFTPKSLLRYPACVSKAEEFTTGGFKELIDDATVKAEKVTRILFCSGKVYYDLLLKQQADKREDVALVRLEQIYPLPTAQIEAVVAKYKNAKDMIWVQEEPRNMGAWPFLCRKFRHWNLDVISRKESSSTATGFGKQHASQQEYIINKAFETTKAELPVKKIVAKKVVSAK